MANTIRIRAWLDDQVSDKLDKIRDRFDRLGGKGASASLFGNVGAKAIGKGFELIGDAASMAADFVDDSIDAARDLSETLSKSRVVFGDAAGDVEAYGDRAAKAIGLSKQAAIEAAATFGNFFVGLGQTGKEAASMSTKVVGLAGDLASFNNLDPNDVLDKLRAGLAGEAEPLRRLGVFLTEAKVKAKATEMGLADAHGELSEGAKVLARYQIILDETTTAQGDFARTADGLANSQRTANAELIDAQANLGESFEPIALGVTRAQIAIVDWFNHGVEGWQMLGKAVGDVAGQHEEAAGLIVDAQDEAQYSLGETHRATALLGEATVDMKDVVASANEAAAASYEKLAKAAVSAAEEAIQNAFDPIIAHDQLIAANAEEAAQRRILSSDKATKAEKTNARAALHQAQLDIAQYLLTLAKAGDTNTKAYATGIENLKEAIKSAKGPTKAALQEVLDKINAVKNAGRHVDIVFRIQGGIYKNKPLPSYDEGGMVPGPRGAPQLAVVHGGEYVVPSGGASLSGSGGGGGGAFVYAPMYSTASPEEAQRFVRAITPALTREMRRQSLL